MLHFFINQGYTSNFTLKILVLGVNNSVRTLTLTSQCDRGKSVSYPGPSGV